MLELPRVTRSLRMFTNLGRKYESLEERQNDLLRKRKEQEKKTYRGLTWAYICKNNSTDAISSLHKLLAKATQILGDCCEELSFEFAIHILRLLIDQEGITNAIYQRLEETIQHIKRTDIQDMMKLVIVIREKLNPETLRLLRNFEEKTLNAASDEINMFGETFVYHPAKVLWPDTKKLRSMRKKNVLDSTNEFTMAYKDREKPEKRQFDKTIYNKKIKLCYSKLQNKLSFHDFHEFESEIEAKLQNCSLNMESELLDIFGSEQIELILYIIQHRKNILSMYKKLRPQKQYFGGERPVIGSQVIVQSLEEKMTQKLVRKEEKKQQKLAKRDPGESINTESASLRLRKQEAAVARRAPLFARSTAVQESYPFVFDSRNVYEVKSMEGQNAMLPENAVRKDSPSWEEVHIPIPNVNPENEPRYESILIENLDEIVRLAFKGTTSLNRIQSIVFDKAYQTNENLLICAPTGAGKTNVALLTILREVKQHMNNGELIKNMFKIIYIAPMKALASEMTASFGKRLGCLGVTVRELTGDMQLTKREIQQAQMIVTTPEKWDVMTRKGTGDVLLTSIVKLLIIDEVHLLQGDRGPVIEALVARTKRQVESSQSMIRIVGLSATLPNYLDVAQFLEVSPRKGLFYFDHRFRPVPLGQTFVGVKSTNQMQQNSLMDQACYEKVIEALREGYQAMVFVHARAATMKVAKTLRELAIKRETIKFFVPGEHAKFKSKAFANSSNRYLAELFESGLSVHHAGLLRTDRNLVEKYFGQGLVKVLVCTSTLAWGVNLPAHVVIIRGTEIYDTRHGSYTDLGILDVLQIFGRAGRPQYDTSGHAVIVTTHNKLHHYLSLLSNQIPIESTFVAYLADNLNAEVALGTISNVAEAVRWLSYTYLFVRMKQNFQAYGISYKSKLDDPHLMTKRMELIDTAATALDKAKMVRYNKRTGDLGITELGRIASHFYLKYDTIEIFNESIEPVMNEAEILAMISRSQEFEQLKVREDEMPELEELMNGECKVYVKGGVENIHGKVNILLQTFLSRGRVNSFSLASDQNYIVQNAARICQALFKIMLWKNNPIMAGRLLNMVKMFDHRQWDYQTPLRQFRCLPQDIIDKIESRDFTVERLRDMESKEIGLLLSNQKYGALVKKCCEEFPNVEIESNLQPITRTVLRIRLTVHPRFRWNDYVHGTTPESYWLWIEDPQSDFIYHCEYFNVTRKMVCNGSPQEIVLTIPLSEPTPTQCLARATSERWLGCEVTHAMNFQDLILPAVYPPCTNLLKLQPLPIKVLKEPSFENLYAFSHFNPIQTQIFHCLYHTDSNVLLGAPTGAGKTVVAEIAMFRLFKRDPTQKVVYIAPLKALVRERMKDWKVRLEERLGKRVVELTGDVSPDVRMIDNASVIVTTPEKWDGISRSWQTRGYVKDVALMIIDEIHLLGEDRGPVLEVIISRTNFISSHTSKRLRIVGLSTTLANAVDLANWLGIEDAMGRGLYNFRPSARSVPLEIHIHGFQGKHYCPRMAMMNRPTFQAIMQFSEEKPALVFVSSRRQTRLTALDLMAYLAAEANPKKWLHMPEEEMNDLSYHVKDSNLKLTLAFGIGLHHAGLQDSDRNTVEELFLNNKIQVLIATATLAWGVNFPAHLVVIKGTEYYDAKTKNYVDMPITDILQMMGRAGRPQFDNSGVAVVLVHDLRKNFYKKFLYEPFPVESSLLAVLPDHVNAEIVAGTIKNNQEFMDYLTWTYFFRRLMKNPKYYDLDVLEPDMINLYLSSLVEKTLKVLIDSDCIAYDEDERTLYPLSMGKIASFYYLSHRTMSIFKHSLQETLPISEYLRVLTNAHEYSGLPVRHNEELLNEELAKMCRFPVVQNSYDSPHTKAFLLLQAHFSRLPLPCADYITDLKSVLDQAIRIIQALIDVVAENGWLSSTLKIITILQMTIQARWYDESSITTLPHVNPEHMKIFSRLPSTLPELCTTAYNKISLLNKVLDKEFTENQIYQIYQVIRDMPIVNVDLALQDTSSETTRIVKICLKEDSDNCIQVRRNQDYTLYIGTKRQNKSRNLRAHCPMFQKGKDEGWFLILGNNFDGELMALKRVSGINEQRKTHQVQFKAPSTLGKTKLTFFFLSDCYLGFDQQYEIDIDVEQ